MKIEKIKNFNQIILAIVGILGIILLIIGISQEFRFGPSKNTDITDMKNSMISDEKIEMLNQENQRLQMVSYELPKLVDTLNTIYIIPVSVSTFDKPETVVETADDGNMALLESYNSSPPHLRSSISYPKNYIYGLFTNIIVYQPIANKTTLLFNERIMLGELLTYDFTDDILLVFYISEKDTNKDGFINLDDDKYLCIYSLKTGKMRRITDGTNSVANYQFIENSKDLLVEFSLSQYSNVKFKSNRPRKIMKYEFESDKLSEVVPIQIQQKIQNLVEGKKTQ